MFEELTEEKNTEAVWVKAHREIKELLQDPFEKIANYYFDFLAYTESKVSGKKVGDIIFDKVALSWKK